MLEHECILEPLCRSCTVGGTIAVIFGLAIGFLAISGAVLFIRSYFNDIEERICELERAKKVQEQSNGGKKNVRK